MKNVKISVSSDKKTATITIDLTKRLGPSASGKKMMVGTTGGNQVIPGTDVTIGINAYTDPE
jgi:hypothetical protein